MNAGGAVSAPIEIFKHGDYWTKSASGRTYRVVLRGPGLFENYCPFPDSEPANTSW